MAAAAVASAAVAVLASLLLLSAASPLPHHLPTSSFPSSKLQVPVKQCSYTVVFKTSCSSPRLTRDAISIAFGDAYRNEVYAAHINDPATRAFERCSSDTYHISGPCGYGVCYLFVYRQGWDGWVPESVKVYGQRGWVSFYFGVAVPSGTWYGFNRCPRVAVDGVGGGEVLGSDGVKQM